MKCDYVVTPEGIKRWDDVYNFEMAEDDTGLPDLITRVGPIFPEWEKKGDKHVRNKRRKNKN